MRPPVAEPILLLADIHGNMPALKAVLEEAKRCDVRRAYVAGDLVSEGQEPLEVWRCLQTIDAHCVRGVSDTALTSIDPRKVQATDPVQQAKLDRFAQTQRALGELVLEQIRRLPLSLRVPLLHGGELIVVHGSPRDPMTEMSVDLSDEELLDLWDDDPAEIVVCGGSHVPFQRALEEVHIVNVGSVGAAPDGPTAHFTVLTPNPSGTTIHQDWVRY